MFQKRALSPIVWTQFWIWSDQNGDGGRRFCPPWVWDLHRSPNMTTVYKLFLNPPPQSMSYLKEIIKKGQDTYPHRSHIFRLLGGSAGVAVMKSLLKTLFSTLSSAFSGNTSTEGFVGHFPWIVDACILSILFPKYLKRVKRLTNICSRHMNFSEFVLTKILFFF